MTWAEAVKQTAYTAELERKTVHGPGTEDHLLMRLQRDHATTHAELQASRRCAQSLFALLPVHGRESLILSEAHCSLQLHCNGQALYDTGGGEEHLLACPPHAEHQLEAGLACTKWHRKLACCARGSPQGLWLRRLLYVGTACLVALALGDRS